MKAPFIHWNPGGLARRRILRRTCAIALLALSTPLLSASGAADDPLTSLIAAERSFAADAGKIGLTPAFKLHAAADAILFRPGPTPALAELARQGDQHGLELEWAPGVAAVSRSADLGFTTGPYRMRQEERRLHGQFLTIWQREKGGSWKWYLDFGLPPIPEEKPTAFPTEVRDIGPVRRATTTDGAAREPLEAIEDGLNGSLRAGDWRALITLLADDGMVLRPRLGVLSKSDAARTLPGRKAIVGAERLGMRVAEAGDLAVSFGRLDRGVGSPAAYYVRVWRRDGADWVLLADEVV